MFELVALMPMRHNSERVKGKKTKHSKTNPSKRFKSKNQKP